MSFKGIIQATKLLPNPLPVAFAVNLIISGTAVLAEEDFSYKR